ncbi:MAG: translocation/assembly module TamB domain-containing protein, partial [Steroidobacterales bacterium]
MARVGRAIAWIVAAALLLAAGAITAVWIAASSDPGRRLIERALARVSGGQIIAAGLAGHFPGDLRLAHLELRDRQGAWAEADNLRLQWSPGALAHGQVRIELLQIGQAQIARAPLSTAASGSSRQVGRFWTHIDLLRLEVLRLGLGAPLMGTPVAMQVIGSGQLHSLQDASVVLAVDRLDAPGRYHLSAQFDAAQMTAVLQLAEPAGGPLANLLQLPALGALSAQLRLQGPRNAEVLDASVAAGPLRARASGSLNLKQQSADLAISITAPSMAPRADLSWEGVSLQGRWQGTLAAAMTSAHLEIARLVAAGGSASSISADLRGERGALQLTGLLRGVRLPGPQPELLAAAPIAVRATANLGSATRAVTFAISHPLASMRGSAALGADRSLLLTATVPTLKPLAALAGVDLDGRGTVTLRAAMRNTAAAPLRLDLDATIDAAPGASPLAALLAGGAKIGVTASIVGEQVRISKAHIDSKLLNATVEGSRTAQTLEARWQLAIASLQALSPALQGRLSAQGQLSGPVRELRAEADLSGEFAIHGSRSGPMEAHLRATGLPASPAGSLDLRGTLDGAPLRLRAVAGRGANGTLRLSLERGEWKSAHAEGVMSLPANGANPQGRIALRMSRLADLQTLLATAMQGSIAGELHFAPSGARSRGELRAEARDLAFAERHVGTVALSVVVDQLDMNSKRATASALQLQIQDRVLRLLAPARFAFGDGFTVNHLRLGLQQAVLEVDGRLAPQLDLRATLSNITPQLLQAVADGRLGGAMVAAADGTLSADARLTGSTAAPRGSVHVTATGLHVRAGAASALPPADFSATANLGEGSAKIQLALSAGALLQLHANGSVPLSGQAVLDVHAGGQLNLSLANPLLEANGRRVQGQLQIDAALSGSYSAPQARGTVHLLHGELQDYARGAHLTDISASIEAGGDTLRLTSFSARAGSGTVSMSGSFGALRPELPLDLTLSAHNAQPLASDLLTANLDLNLSLRGQLRRHVEVAGRIRVNRADINIPTALPASVAVLDVRRPGHA